MKPTVQRRTLPTALLALACLLAQPAFAEDDDESPLWDFVRGRYTLIGRHPDSQATYTGTAKIGRASCRERV